MGEYADVKRKKVFQMLKWLETVRGFTVENGGAHQIIVKHEAWMRPFPVPFKHNIVKKPIMVELVKKIVSTGACTKEELDARLK